MQRVLADCSEFAAVHINDIVVFSSDVKAHEEHINKVLQALREAGLTAKPSKCQWGRQTLEYLGHVVGYGKYFIPQARVAMLQEFACPVTKKQLQSYLGMMGYYCTFIPNLANYSTKLTPATSSKAPAQVVWTEQITAFESLKGTVCKTADLTIPESDDILYSKQMLLV